MCWGRFDHENREYAPNELEGSPDELIESPDGFHFEPLIMANGFFD
jgi:hypothetical protein